MTAGTPTPSVSDQDGHDENLARAVSAALHSAYRYKMDYTPADWGVADWEPLAGAAIAAMQDVLRHRNDIAGRLLAERDRDVAIALLRDAVGDEFDEPCNIDHNQNCQSHGWFVWGEQSCYVARAKEFLTRFPEESACNVKSSEAHQ